MSFEEARAHLGIETQRQWNDLAIARTTPALFGLFSAIALMANRLIKTEVKPVRAAAWYEKQTPTFADAIATVRLCLWGGRHFSTSGNNSDVVKVPRSLLERLTDAVCYAAWMDKVELSFSQSTLENNFGVTCGSLSVVLQAEGFDEQSESLE